MDCEVDRLVTFSVYLEKGPGEDLLRISSNVVLQNREPMMGDSLALPSAPAAVLFVSDGQKVVV